MALISQTIKNLKGGISQQPDILRYAEQGAEQVNGWSSETEGLQKRAPSVFVKTLDVKNAFGYNPLVHLINRDENEQYYAVFTGSGIRVVDMAGKEYSVTGDMSYVTTGNPRKDLRMITVADYTFVVNRTRYVEVNPDVTDRGFRDDGDCLINVRGGQYGRTLEVWVNGMIHAKVTLPDGSDAKDSRQTDAQWIAWEIRRQLKGEGVMPDTVTPLPSDWTVNVGTGYVHIIAPANVSIYDFRTMDGYANQLINPVTHYMQSFTKLPVEAPNGFKVKIVGDTSKTADQYYVQYDMSKKVWRESIGWGVTYALDYSTMPWALVRQADGNFKFEYHPWETRKVGDDDTNPHPSLVGQTINDIFFFRNRLGFLSGENIVMSRTSHYFNLYPPSVANLSDDDPIDVAVSHNRISILKYAVPFSEELLLWSDQAQFVLSAQGILSSKSVELNLTTEFDVSDGARPFGIGRNIYFASPRASYTSINRYYAVQEVSSVKSSEDMTSHVPNYIPNGVFNIHGSSTENYLSVLSEGEMNKVFIYKFLYLDEEIRQQSWSHWDFGEDVQVLAASAIGSTMYVLAQNNFNVYMTQVNFTKNSVDYQDEPYRIYLDRKKQYVIPSWTYNDDTYTTTINLRDIYGMSFDHGQVSIVETDGRVETYDPPEGGWDRDLSLRLNGNQEGELIYIGFNIPFRYVFSKFLIKKTAEDGSTSTEDIGRLQLRRAWVNYEQSGAFTIEVENTSRVFRYEMAGARLGSNNLRVGELNLGTGQFRFPTAGNALLNTVRILSNETTPLNVIGCGWEGNYQRRSSGI